jgi:geranylgeranylglycerol-phosphate geranylgeranyltransferase
MSKAAGFTQLIRPINSIMMGIATVIGEIIAIRDLPGTTSMLLGFITAFFLTAASMVVNDYYDRKVDEINAPDRPLPSRIISPNEALFFSIILTIIGLFSASVTNLQCLFTAIVGFVVSFGYNTKGKETGLPGNLMVSVCVSLPFIYGGFVVSTFDTISVTTIIFSMMAFLSNTGREITKGIADVEGDRLRNIKTVALRSGARRAALISAIFYFSAIALSVLPWILSSVTWVYLPIVLISDTGFIYSSISLLRNSSRENSMRVKNLILIWMMLALIAIVVGGMLNV